MPTHLAGGTNANIKLLRASAFAPDLSVGVIAAAFAPDLSVGVIVATGLAFDTIFLPDFDLMS